MTVVFAKHGRSEADLGLLEAEIRNGAVLSDHGHACKYNWHNSNKLKSHLHKNFYTLYFPTNIRQLLKKKAPAKPGAFSF